MYSTITFTKSPSLRMTTSRPSLKNLTVFQTQSRDCSYYVRRRMTPTPLWLQKHTDRRAHESAHSPDLWRQPRLAKATCAWSWRLCGNRPAVRVYIQKTVPEQKHHAGETYEENRWVTTSTPDYGISFIFQRFQRTETIHKIHPKRGWVDSRICLLTATQVRINVTSTNRTQSLSNLLSDYGIYNHRGKTSGIHVTTFP